MKLATKMQLLLTLLLRRWQKKIIEYYHNFPKIKYFNIRDAAWIFLLRNKIISLPLELSTIASNNNWYLLPYEQNTTIACSLDKNNRRNECDGWTTIFNKRVFIFYKNLNNEGRKRFTIAHEFGHLELLHLTALENSEYEKEANMFAARILMPLCVLKEINAFTPEKIAIVCKTSITAASYRAIRLHNKIKLDKFYKSKLELKVKRRFKKYIKNHKTTNNS